MEQQNLILSNMKLYIFFTFFFLKSLVAQEPEKEHLIESIEIIAENSKENYNKFSKHYKKQPFAYHPEKAKIKGYFQKNSSKIQIDGEFRTTLLLGINNYTAEDTNDKNIEKHIENLFKIAHSHWLILKKDITNGFYCKQLDDKNWKFIAIKNTTKQKMKIKDEDDYNYNIVVSLNDKGILQSIKSQLLRSNDQYELEIFFQKYKNGVFFSEIKIKMNNDDEYLNAIITFEI